MTERYRQSSKDIQDVKVQVRSGLASSPSFALEFLRESIRLLPIGVIIFVLMLWLLSMPMVKPREMTDIGLLSVLPVTFYIALGVLTFSFCFLAFRQPERRWVLNLHVLTFILMIHATPAILYGTLRYSWAWKHVGIIDYIVRHGGVNPTIDFLNAYHNWPGFFALNAFIVEATGLDSALVYASGATLFFNLLFFGALLMIFRSLTDDRRVVWLSVWFFFLSDWIGQDYFSPQSFAYFFYLVMLGILLRWFAWRRSHVVPGTRPVNMQANDTRLRRLVKNLRGKISPLVPGPAVTPAQRILLIFIVILLMAVITFSHQLTPMMTISALAFLVLFGLVYPRSLPVLMGVMALTWIFFIAGSFTGPNLKAMLSSFGSVQSNVSGNLINLNSASIGQVVIALMGRGLTLLVMLAAGLGFLRRLIKGHVDLAALLLVIVPFPMLVANSYGGEILFRIYFFALPFMAFFMATLFMPDPLSGHSRAFPFGAALLSLVIITGFLFAYYGKEKQYYFTPGEVTAANMLYDNALPGSLIIEGTRNYPTLFRNYEQYTYVPIDREPQKQMLDIVNHPVEELTRWMENRQYSATYLFITRSMKAEVDMIGVMPPGSLDSIEQKLIASGKFDILYQNQDAAIFILKGREQ